MILKAQKQLFCFLICLLILICNYSKAQPSQKDSVVSNKKWVLPTIVGTSYMTGMTGLYQIWYKDNLENRFRFFNDNHQWKQLDKLGHAYTTYQLGKLSFQTMKNLGYSQKEAIWGSTIGFWMLLPIEVFDGFSPTYGASWGDIVANGLGTGLFLSQEYFWQEQRIHFKFSYSHSPYAAIRPQVLGDSFASRLIKDYNGQTYWLSSSPFSWAKNQKSPKWLAIAIGHGATQMLYGNELENREAGYQSRRVWYLSLDVNWEGIRSKRKGVRLLLSALNSIKVPFPAIYFDSDKSFGFSLLAF